MDQEHEESWRMRIYNKLLTGQVKFVLLVVNSIKLHLTAFKLWFQSKKTILNQQTLIHHVRTRQSISRGDIKPAESLKNNKSKLCLLVYSDLLHAYEVIPEEVLESLIQFKANKLGSCEIKITIWTEQFSGMWNWLTTLVFRCNRWYKHF